MSELRLPFLGTTSDHEVFEYLLLKLKAQSALIALPKWLVCRVKLIQHHHVNLHLRGYSKSATIEDKFIGKVDIIQVGHDFLNAVYAIRFNGPIVGLSLRHEGSEPVLHLTVLAQLFKDILFLKTGVGIYLKHLIPFFSRIIKLSKNRYKHVKELVLEDFKNQVADKVTMLHTFCNNFSQVKNREDLVTFLDLEYLRGLVQSELDVTLFDLAFEKKDNKETFLKHAEPNSIQSCNAYMNAIKLLEGRLYSNFNNVVMTYTHLVRQL